MLNYIVCPRMIILASPILLFNFNHIFLVKVIPSSIMLSNTAFLSSPHYTAFSYRLQCCATESAVTSPLQLSKNRIAMHPATSSSTSLNIRLRKTVNSKWKTNDPHGTPITTSTALHRWHSTTRLMFLSNIKDPVHLTKSQSTPSVFIFLISLFLLTWSKAP